MLGATAVEFARVGGAEATDGRECGRALGGHSRPEVSQLLTWLVELPSPWLCPYRTFVLTEEAGVSP